MSNNEQSVLCLPRSFIAGCGRFTPWATARQMLLQAQANMTWLPRSEAERSEALVQPIPCALVVSEDRFYHVFRRINEGRADLKKRLSLVIGGHIDCGREDSGLYALTKDTLMREVGEELDFGAPPSSVEPVGLVIDPSSLESSRHVGVVYEVVIAGKIKPKAPEEFSMRSKYDGKPCTPQELLDLRKEFDPWSMIIFGEYINPSYAHDLGSQLSLAIVT